MVARKTQKRNIKKGTDWMPGETELPGQTTYLQGKSSRTCGVLGLHELKDLPDHLAPEALMVGMMVSDFRNEFVRKFT